MSEQSLRLRKQLWRLLKTSHKNHPSGKTKEHLDNLFLCEGTVPSWEWMNFFQSFSVIHYTWRRFIFQEKEDFQPCLNLTTGAGYSISP
jgi:hypothetical protein